MRRPRMLFVQPSLQPPGGGNAVAVCALAALKDDFEITLLTLEPVDLIAIRDHYGIALERDDIDVRTIGRAWSALLAIARVRGALLQRYILLRAARRIASEFDVVVSFNNELDAGDVRVVQYVHYPWGIWPRPEIELRAIHRIPGLLRAYYALARRLAPVSRARIAANITLVNSDWTGQQFRACYGGEPITLHPPLMGHASHALRAWEEREDVVLALGLFAPHKRLERVIEIVERVRMEGHPLRLWIAGTIDRHHRSYGRLVRELAARHPWIELKENLDRRAIDDLLGRARYGVHAMADEHFGMAVAEMAAAGCIPFVPAAGGQVEVVAQPELLYQNVDDAVAKIVSVVNDAELQLRLRDALRESSSRFAPGVFRQRLQAILAAATTRVS